MDKITIKSLRELDELVEERIMGLREKLISASSQAEYETLRKRLDWCPDYSGSIEIAWKIASLFDRNGMGLAHIRDKWRVFSMNDPNEKWPEGDTPAISICLAELKAKGIEVELELGKF